MLCDQHRSNKCRGRIQRKINSNEYEETQSHCHEKPEVKFFIHQFIQEFKKAVKSRSSKPSIIYDELCLKYVFVKK